MSNVFGNLIPMSPLRDLIELHHRFQGLTALATRRGTSGAE